MELAVTVLLLQLPAPLFIMAVVVVVDGLLV
jgi:hypothetical protein